MKKCLRKIKPRVLITAIGSFSAYAVIKSFKKAGVFVAGCDIYNENWVVNSKDCDAFRQAPLCADEATYIYFIRTYCHDLDLSYVIPLTDPEVDLLSRLSDDLQKDGITVCAPPCMTVEKVRNKMSFSLIAKEISKDFDNIGFIPTCYLKDAPADHPMPAVIKPVTGRSSIGKQIISSREEFDAIRGLSQYSDHIIQPFIDGNIVTADILRDSLGNTVIYARRELLRTVSGAGTCVETLPEFSFKDYCVRIAEALDIVGCVNIEFVEEKRPGNSESSKYYPLEINPRFSGGIEFSCLSGFDFPLAFLKIYEGLNTGSPYVLPKDPPACKPAVYSRRYTTYGM